MSTDKKNESNDKLNQDPAAALDAKNSNLTEEQQKHREELYGYKHDAEGTLDTSTQLENAMSGTPSGATTGPDPDTESTTDELRITGFNNPIDDNNR
ncbi:hypothetical protein [Hymenobacter psychrophilus]|uniref:Uncharacterized protein n=1 Tax=Hymenobacter psychrophilus TaxID=651662 RepID=A0A1H3IXS0_9BACT|nr:hypothetical protein [Hymenobacter psychrophilus]SDY32520.1 hypothetical protein SAMN04488069_107199 [Hymenobacter psychrophilus]